jgi:hypothetical protein
VGHIHGATGTIPIFQQHGTPGVFQAIQMPLVQAGAKPITTRQEKLDLLSLLDILKLSKTNLRSQG